jgi:hypothetical protein
VVPVAENTNGVPGMRVSGVNTGDWPGAESPEQQVLPFGMPASQGFAVPGIDTITVA